MGLDAIEIVMAVEDHFEIEIPDEIAGTLDTPGKLKAFTRRHVPDGAHGNCLSQRAFYRLRSAVQNQDDAHQSSIRPNTAWADIVFKPERRQRWRALEIESELTLPSLVRPREAKFIILVLAMASAVTAFFIQSEIASSLVRATLSFAAVSAAGTWITIPLARCFPREYATVGAVAESVAAGRPAHLLREGEGWSGAEISDAIDWIIERQVGILRTEFTDDSQFVRDLGID